MVLSKDLGHPILYFLTTLFNHYLYLFVKNYFSFNFLYKPDNDSRVQTKHLQIIQI